MGKDLVRTLMQLVDPPRDTADPGTFGLRDESIYRAEYRVAVDEMCERGTKEWSLGGHRRLCHTCMIVRPLRSKHSPALAVDKCVPRFDHHCPWVGNTVGFENHPMFVAYTVSTWVCLGMSCRLRLRFLADKSVWDEPAVAAQIAEAQEKLDFAVKLFYRSRAQLNIAQTYKVQGPLQY